MEKVCSLLQYKGLPMDDPMFRQIAHVGAGVAFFCFICSFFSGNASQFDKVWPILPVAFMWMMIHHSAWSNTKLLWMTLITTVWGVRLALDLNRRGGYGWPPWKGIEDFRWSQSRKRLRASQHPLRWQLYIAASYAFQCVTLIGMILPAYTAYKRPISKMDTWDWSIGLLSIALVIIEGVADDQHWRYPGSSRRQGISGGPLTAAIKKVFRYPSYVYELAVWTSMYVFSHRFMGLNWSCAGIVLLTLMTYGSKYFR